MSDRQPVGIAATRECQIRICADFPSVREDVGYSLWVVQHKVVGCFPRVEALAVRRCARKQLTCWQTPAYRLVRENVEMAVQV